MSDIFYSNVDPVLQAELIARAAAGKSNRTTRDFDFMLGKVANVQIIPYKTEYTKKEEGKGDTKKVTEVIESKTKINEAILGGYVVRQGSYLPSGPNGFLSDRKYQIIDSASNPDLYTTSDRFNTSKRTGPYISSAEIAIGDNSMGMMNTATVNIIIPNPGQDINYFESIYLRPGRHVTMIFQHPESAVITRNNKEGGILSVKTLPSLKKLQEIDPKLTAEQRDKKYGKLNTVTLDAVIVSFTLDYQPDGSVNASLSMRGASQLYTELSMFINDETTDSDKKDEDQNTFKNKTFYSIISDKVNSIIEANGGLSKSSVVKIGQNEDSYVVWGKPLKSNGTSQRYVTLGFLIDEINELIVSKSIPLVGQQKIICTSKQSLCTSILYDYLVSVYPEDMFIPGGAFSSYKGNNYWYADIKNKLPNAAQLSSLEFEIDPETGETITNTIEGRLFPAKFFINMNYIQKLLISLKELEEKSYNLNKFLSTVSSLINKSTGGAIDLKLITHPLDDKSLLFYDRANVLPQKEKVNPFVIPMFANDPIGSVVRDFTFSGKLPSEASNLAYVLNQNPADLSENEIAPFLSYMYSAAVTERDSAGNETIRSLVTPTQQQQVKQKYKENHEKFLNELQQAKAEFGKDFNSSEKQLALRDKLKQYIQFPTPELKSSYQLKAPVIPFDCSFTIDGINGFKYGDVVQFNGLPKRYTQNAVFCVVHVSHTVDNSGIWTTQLRCIMRPNIDLE